MIPRLKHPYVWQVSLQVTSPERPALKHQLQYRTQAIHRDDAISQARALATRDGHTVVDVVGAARGYKVPP
jgi:hypothetical protein